MRRLAASLVSIILLVAACSSTAQPSGSSTPAGPNIATGAIGAARYIIETPQNWNGTLFLYSHGYVAPGAGNPASASPDPALGDWLLAGGYGLAASSYSSTGWAIEDALHDQIALLDHIEKQIKPKRVIAIGASLGGIITAGLVQDYPTRFAGAISLCGVLAGGVATWNSGLDAAYAFKTLLAPGSQLQLVHITDPPANAKLAADLEAQAVQTPAGQARMALVAALADIPGWFLPTQPEPGPTDYAGMAAAQAQWESRIDFPFAFDYRAELEQRAGGNPSWNVGVDYRDVLDRSRDLNEVVALYARAGINLSADLTALNAGATIRPDASAVAYLNRYITFDGDIGVPVITAHTTADGLVIPQNDSAYGDAVRIAGQDSLLRQLFVHRAGHCAFTSAEVIMVIKAMLHRLDTGSWDDASLQSAAMNAAATALGARYNSIGGFFAASPAFTTYSPGQYPRPFTLGSSVPA